MNIPKTATSLTLVATHDVGGVVTAHAAAVGSAQTLSGQV